MAGYQGLQNGPVAGGLAPVVLAPCRPHLLAPAGVVGPLALLPEFLSLVGIRPPILRRPLGDQPVELEVYAYVLHALLSSVGFLCTLIAFAALHPKHKTVMPHSIVASPSAPPRRPLRSAPRRPARRCSRARRGRAAAPTARGGSTPAGGCRGPGWRGGAGRRSCILHSRRLEHNRAVALPLGGVELLGVQDGLDQVLEALVTRHLEVNGVRSGRTRTLPAQQPAYILGGEFYGRIGRIGRYFSIPPARTDFSRTYST